MSDNDAVDAPARRNRYVVYDAVNRVSQKFETGNKGDIEFAALEFSTQCSWMIEINSSVPSVNQRACIEIFDAANPERLHNEIFIFLRTKIRGSGRGDAQMQANSASGSRTPDPFFDEMTC